MLMGAELNAMTGPVTHSRTALIALAFRCIRFFAPILLVAGCFELLLWMQGETWTVATVLEYQHAKPDSMFLRGVFDQALQPYKLEALQRIAPDVIALGSSRVMQFRQSMFGRDGRHFYNAGGLVHGLHDLHHYLDWQESRPLPKVILLGVDVWWFNGNVAPRAWTAVDSSLENWRAHLTAVRELLRKPNSTYQAFRKWDPADRRWIGLEAQRSRGGFRSDGSRFYNYPLPATTAGWAFVDRETPPLPARVDRHQFPFLPTRHISCGRLLMMDDALRRLRSMGIAVIGFAAPFSTETTLLALKDSGQRELWLEFATQVPALFSRYGFPFVDASRTELLGLDDRYMFDGFHGTETFHAVLLHKITEHPYASEALPAARSATERMLSASGTNFWYLGEHNVTQAIRRRDVP